jgi:hypothetical protein
MWVQHHNGIFVSSDEGRTFSEITGVEPSVFGFPVGRRGSCLASSCLSRSSTCREFFRRSFIARVIGDPGAAELQIVVPMPMAPLGAA